MDFIENVNRIFEIPLECIGLLRFYGISWISKDAVRIKLI